MTAGVALIMGIANYTLSFGEVKFEGIILGTVAAVVVYHLMNGLEKLRGSGSSTKAEATKSSEKASAG
jgi:NCS2 family nucleobase:cation symporter-2